MAAIEEKIKDGKIVSFKFKACLGRDPNGKQVFRCKTWFPEEGLTNNKSRKAAAAAAAEWEQAAKQAFLLEQEEQERQAAEAAENAKILTFGRFVREVWLPLAVNDGEHRPSTVAMYNAILDVLLPHFDETPLQEVTALQITAYLKWLRTDYRTKYGKPPAEKTIKHHYNILRIAFNYAEKHDLIVKNPMRKVASPKVTKRKVDALSKEETAIFFAALESCELDFRCMLQLMITAGLRRGECLGLQWQDIDFDALTLSVQRNAVYTKASGVIIGAPKTATSIRTIPLMNGTAALLKEYQRRQRERFAQENMDEVFLFCREKDPFQPREPTKLTYKIKRFFEKAGLPDMSPHDLRHSCASLLLASGADIKSVQEIMGHADASTTLNYYVASDLQQARSAVDRMADAFGI